MVSIKTDTSRLEFALAQLALEAKVGLGPVIKEEARYLVKTFIQFTPPKSASQGRNAVSKDIGKLAVSLDYSKLMAKANEGGFYKSMARLVRKRETEKLRQLFQNPNLKFYYGRKVMGNYGELADQHRKQRNNYGRISKDRMLAAYSGDVKRLRKEISDRVGWTASGWIPAARATGAQFKKFTDKFGDRSGTVRSNFGTNPFVDAINRQVKIPDYQRMIDGAIRSRTTTTLKKLDRLMAKKAVNLGFTRVGGNTSIAEAA